MIRNDNLIEKNKTESFSFHPDSNYFAITLTRQKKFTFSFRSLTFNIFLITDQRIRVIDLDTRFSDALNDKLDAV